MPARASSSDLLMRLDIVIMAGDSELIDSARSTNSSAHSRGELLDRKLLVPTWIIISSGFLLDIVLHILHCASRESGYLYMGIPRHIL